LKKALISKTFTKPPTVKMTVK